MSHFEDASFVSNHKYPCFSTITSRQSSTLYSKDATNDMLQFGIDYRTQPQQSNMSTTKRIIQHHVCVPTSSRRLSSPFIKSPSPLPDTNPALGRSSPISTGSRMYRPRPVQMKATALTIPISKNREEKSHQNFPKQTHEKRKITIERKRKKQEAQTLAEKYADTETWFQLRRSLAELKRLATTQEVIVDPTTSAFNCDGHSFATLKQIIAEQQEDKKAAALKSESGLSSSSFGSVMSSRDLNRASQTASYSSLSRPRMIKRPTETYPRLIFEPFIVATKPIHSSLSVDTTHSPQKPRIKPPASLSPQSRLRPNSTTAIIYDKNRSRLLISDLSNYDEPAITPSQSPPLIKTEQDTSTRRISTPSPTRLRPPSSIQFASTIKLKQKPPRCRSATDMKPSYFTSRHNLRFILIADEEHRIESWYHQYPFVLGDDLLALLDPKQTQQKTTIAGYFIDDLNSSKANLTAKTFLQGKPFNINNDWKKYDLIFISNNIYEQTITYLKTVVNLLKSSGKIIKIYQINHEEDLKRQVRNICKQLQQQNV